MASFSICKPISSSQHVPGTYVLNNSSLPITKGLHQYDSHVTSLPKPQNNKPPSSYLGEGSTVGAINRQYYHTKAYVLQVRRIDVRRCTPMCKRNFMLLWFAKYLALNVSLEGFPLYCTLRHYAFK